MIVGFLLLPSNIQHTILLLTVCFSEKYVTAHVQEDDSINVTSFFSRQEWLDVYEAIFSNNISLWKEAQDTMLVWQAR